MRQFYLTFKDEKVSPMGTQLTWTHFRELLSIKNINKINYYIKITEQQNLSVRQLREEVKNKEYERLDDKNVKTINQEPTLEIIICRGRITSLLCSMLQMKTSLSGICFVLRYKKI